ncbi:NAD(P)-binding protein [Solimicrobium silvestre]|uniref:NAD(P)-binding Rossmann-like domain n=1 Tax=Solimicrobium silvestre TaxID=2099400 RepID=A0A2S9H3V4_9BURK|nr:FAD/NAD(P)-binding protein [Solimicrobium silvestre]PRC94665.1 NAD(P)-binding Rossmann-like domain [Solimicrobium silvestre]
MNDRDKCEGITRRDLLQSLALAISVPGLLTSEQSAAQTSTSAQNIPNAASTVATQLHDAVSDYPPARTGLRGTHVGAFEVAHNLRDGHQPYPIEESGQHYDLVIVGAGISGLAAAWFYRQQRPHARILILDNHDDFGGHAKRNEFNLNGELHLMNGGTLSIQSPRPYSAVAESLLRSVGINAQVLNKRIQNRKFYENHGLTSGIFFDTETFGRDALIRKVAGHSWKQVLADAPLGPQARKDIARIEEDHIDYLPGLTSDQKKQRLSDISYRDFLLDIVKADPETIKFYQQRTHGEYCIGIEAVSALDCWGLDFPGFQGLGLAPGSIPRMGPTAGGFADTEGSVDVHLPDGGATVARSLVRSLIPAAIPGHTVEDLITAHVDYSMLDRPENTLHIRLNSIVVSAKNMAGQEGKPDAVRVEYVTAERGYAVHATQCVMACWNMVIPYLCPELPEPQKEALKSLAKAPLVYASVAIKNWKAFEKLGVSSIYSPGAYFYSVWLNEWLSIGKYHTPHSSDHPIVVHMVHTPCEPGQNGTDQLRIGRAKLLATSLETFQINIRTQLDAMLGKAGFDSSRDILAITVNRWPHGYAFEYDPMLGPPNAPGSEPFVIGRQRFGSIAIANSDSGGLAYMDSAIDQAHRAVSELLST